MSINTITSNRSIPNSSIERLPIVILNKIFSISNDNILHAKFSNLNKIITSRVTSYLKNDLQNYLKYLIIRFIKNQKLASTFSGFLNQIKNNPTKQEILEIYPLISTALIPVRNSKASQIYELYLDIQNKYSRQADDILYLLRTDPGKAKNLSKFINVLSDIDVAIDLVWDVEENEIHRSDYLKAILKLAIKRNQLEFIIIQKLAYAVVNLAMIENLLASFAQEIAQSGTKTQIPLAFQAANLIPTNDCRDNTIATALLILFSRRMILPAAVSYIQKPEIKDKVLREMAITIAKNANSEQASQAINAAIQIEEPKAKDCILNNIAFIFSGRKFHSQALKAALCIQDPNLRRQTLEGMSFS